MSVAATSATAQKIDALRGMLAASEAFQAAVGVDGEADPATEAEGFIYLFGVPINDADDAMVAFPFAIIDIENDAWVKQDNSALYECTTTLLLDLQLDIPEAYQADEQAAAMDFLNRGFQIVDEIMAQSGVCADSRLVIKNVGLSVQPFRASIEEIEDAAPFYCAAWQFHV